MAALASSACEDEPSATDLASLERVGPMELEAGERIEGVGSGFVVGPATLVLDGTLSAPGAPVPRRRVRIALEALATSPTDVSARLGRRHFERFGAQHATFTGRAVVRFPSRAAPHGPAVSASVDDVRLELFASPTAHEARARQGRAEGQALLERIGAVASVLPEGRGLAIEQIRPGSLAARSGMEPGDAIVTAGSLTVAGVADLAPPPRARRLVLGVRSGAGALRRIAFPLEGEGLAPDADRVAAMAMAAVAILFLLVVAGPLRGPTRLLGRALTGDAAGPRGLVRALALDATARPLAAGVSLLAFATAPFVVMALGWTSVVVVAGLLSLASVASGVATSRGLKRIGGAFSGLVATLPLAGAAATSAVGAASMVVDQIVAAQGALPWSWEALSSPGSLLLLIVVVATTCAGEPSRPGPMSATVRGLGGALVAAVLLGGWADVGGNGLVGEVAFALKSWAVGLLFPFAGRARAHAVLTVAGGLAAASIASRVLPLPGWVHLAAPWSAATAAVLLALPLAVRWALRPPSGRLAPLEGGTWVTENPAGPRVPAAPGPFRPSAGSPTTHPHKPATAPAL